MKDLSAYYEIARLITAELSETITPEEKERLNVWLAEDERHYMRYCRIRERLKRGEGSSNVFRNPERVREDMEKLKKKLSGNKRRFLLSGNYFWRYARRRGFYDRDRYRTDRKAVGRSGERNIADGATAGCPAWIV